MIVQFKIHVNGFIVDDVITEELKSCSRVRSTMTRKTYILVPYMLGVNMVNALPVQSGTVGGERPLAADRLQGDGRMHRAMDGQDRGGAPIA
jgi:hypothetical protein